MRLHLFSRHAQKESWTYRTAPILASPAIAALEGKSPSIVLGTRDGRIVCLDHEGMELWTFRASERLSAQEQYFVDEQQAHAFSATPCLADIDGDGNLEVLAATSLGTLYCLSHEGAPLWSIDCKGGVTSSPAVFDMNGDGNLEVLIGAGNRLLVLTAKGKVLFEYDVEDEVTGTPALLARLIVFGTSSGALHAITAHQDAAWKLSLKGKISSAPCVFASSEERRLAIGTHAGILYCVSEHGEIVWEFKTRGAIYHAPTLADVNCDHEDELVFGSCDNCAYVVSLSGMQVWSYETNFWIVAPPIVADFDGDGHLEVAVGSFDHTLTLLKGEGTYMMDYVPGLSSIVPQSGHYAALLTSDPGEQTGKKLAQVDAGDIVIGCALLETINGPALVATTKEGTVREISFS